MAQFHSPRIITDGLVLMLDAANVESYPGSGTTWTDLSGNGNNGTLTNGPTFSSGNGGYFQFDGVDDYVSFSTYSQPQYLSTTSFTWNLWVFPLRNSNADVYMGNRFGGTGENFVKLTSNNFEYYTNNFGGAVPLNNWINLCVMKSQSNLLYYRNGLLHANITTIIQKETQPFYIGGDAAGERSLSYIANASVYDRALTAAEVLQNYNATKGRFGL
jgi:hypothetical protein